MTEKEFARDLVRGLTAQGAYAEKWPDLARAVTKPFDICVGYEGQFMPIECKLRKFTGKERLPGRTVILSPADFRERQHQLPRLLKIWKRRQGHPFIAAFILLERSMKPPIKQGWLIPVHEFEEKDTFILNEVIARQRDWGLVWVPNLGWTTPMMLPPDVVRQQEALS